MCIYIHICSLNVLMYTNHIPYHITYPVDGHHISRPLYGGGSGVCVYFVCPHVVAVLSTPLSPILLSLGCLCRLWLPGDVGGPLWATWGSQVELGVTLDHKWAFFFLNIRRLCDACAAKVTSGGSAADTPEPHKVYAYIYLYVYIYRERDICIHLYICTARCSPSLQ